MNLYHRFDERILLIIFGVVTAIVGRAAFFPFPGVDNPAVCVGVEDKCIIQKDTWITNYWSSDPSLTNLTMVVDELPECSLPDQLVTDIRMRNKHGRFVSLHQIRWFY